MTHDKSILLVDDEPINLMGLGAFLRKYYTVYSASSPLEALSIISKQKIDVIISDNRMPQMTGVELLQKLVDDKINIIKFILTGFTHDHDIKKALETKIIDELFSKPLSQHLLVNKLNEYLNDNDSG